MQQIGSQLRETLREAGLRLVGRPDNDSVILYDPNTELFELWVKNDHHAGYTIEIDGCGYEFARSGDSPDLV